MRLALTALLLAAAAAVAAPPPLPPPVSAELPALQPLGDARLRKMLVHVYDATLWAPASGWSGEAPFALDIRYALRLRGADIARRSVEEMRGLGYADEAELARWQAAMARIFPDIAPGDRLVGAHVPGIGARFYGAAGLIGAIAEPRFARAFFGIWLDERTSEPELRRRLLRIGGEGAR
jgi:hypothetical protein